MSLAIKYELFGVGWVKCSVTDGESQCFLCASDITDALFDLILAATAVISDFSKVCFSFALEPGELRWIISSSGPDQIEFEILEFEDFFGSRPDEEGVRIFHTRCTPKIFAKAVSAAAEEVLHKEGVDGYKSRWPGYPFPAEQLAMLNRLSS